MTSGKLAALSYFRVRVVGVIWARQTRRSTMPETKRDILKVLQDGRVFHATDPRDKIYAFYGLASDSADFIAVDYSRSTLDVFRDFAQRHI